MKATTSAIVNAIAMCHKIYAEEWKRIQHWQRIIASSHTALLESLVTCRLIAVNKNPGLKPIKVWEVLKRISGKVEMMISKEDVIKIAGSLQVCAGQEAGVEAAIHNVHDIFKDHITQAVSLLRKKLHKRIQQRW